MRSPRASRKTPQAGQYAEFDEINGNHRFKQAVPGGFVEYSARARRGGRVTYFNFALAKEMGLIARDHPERMSAALSAKILDTFSLVIINEYDRLHERRFPKADLKPGKYMATRYLQLQHPNKQGRTSGDGRGIWNGEFRRKGVTWDISSSGTGATCLSPACAIEKKFFQTGAPGVGYGNGTSGVDEGLSTALLSEIFHRNGIPTERCLAIISFRSGASINVRASRCLLRPSHFFCHLKQGNLGSLKAAIDFYVDRRIENGDWKRARSGKSRYVELAREMARTFARMAALFESNYVFCWLDWDGDNILADGGIIDYGSVRQFGLYHHDYRFDDVERFSTSIPEQRRKAREIVQAFAQIRDFLLTGRKRPLKDFAGDPVLRIFDKCFARTLNEELLRRMGFRQRDREHLIERHLGLVQAFRKHHSYFEKAQSSRGPRKVADGISHDAIFSTRNILAELPRRLQAGEGRLGAEQFIEIIRSSYARKRDLEPTPTRRREAESFQAAYLALVRQVARKFHGGNPRRLLLEMGMRASVLNRRDRITGDGVIHVTDSLVRRYRRLSFEELYGVITSLVEHQRVIPVGSDVLPESRRPRISPRTRAGALVDANLETIDEHAESL